VLTDTAGIVGFFPYERRRWSTASALAMGLSDVQALVVAPTAELDLRAVLRTCRISVWGFDHLLGHQSGLIGTASARAVPEQSPAIDLRDGFEMYEQRQRQLSSSLFQSTARKRRKLERDHGPVRLLLHSPQPSHLAQVLEWKSGQYRRTGRRDRFADPATVSLVHDLFERQEPTFSAPLTVLMAGDRLVAGHLGLCSAATLAWWFPAYDPEFSAYSPGLILTLELARAMPTAGLSLLDLGKGDEPYKDRLQNLRIPLLRGSAATSAALAGLTYARDWPKEKATNLILGSPRLRGWAREALNQAGALRERAQRIRSSAGREPGAGEAAGGR
jgi:CelD/BcsL family acetyltransferase involved in cellulose biosynthesis